MKRFIFSVALLCNITLVAAQPEPIFNRAPLVSTPYAQLPLGDIQPEGWLKAQMQTMLNGMTGNLDEISRFLLNVVIHFVYAQSANKNRNDDDCRQNNRKKTKP
jgi:hypothetical protein